MAVDVFDLRHDLKGSDVKKGNEAENVYKRKAKQSNTTISNAVLPEVEWIFQSVGCVEPS